MKKYKSERWIHPIHAKGIKSLSIWGSHIGGALTDKKIDKYVSSGFYEMRGKYLKEKRKKDFLPKLVYDINKQDFI